MVDGWTIDTIKQHILSIISLNDQRYSERFTASDRAITKAELANEKRFESVNEFRGTLDNQQRTLIPRSEVDVLVKGLEEKIANNTKQVDALASIVANIQAERQGIKGGWGYAVGVIGFCIALFSILRLIR